MSERPTTDPDLARPIPGAGRFLVVEDHPIFRRALVELLADAFPGAAVEAVGTLAEGERRLAAVRPPPVVLLDLNLPDSTGADGALDLKRAAPDAVIVVLSAESNPEKLKRLAQVGVRGFISKGADPDAFLADLKRLIRRPIAAASPLDGVVVAKEPGVLTPKQHAVLAELARGRSNKEAARSLGIGVETVKSHTAEIMRRLGARNRTEAIRAYLERELALTPVGEDGS